VPARWTLAASCLQTTLEGTASACAPIPRSAAPPAPGTRSRLAPRDLPAADRPRCLPPSSSQTAPLPGTQTQLFFGTPAVPSLPSLKFSDLALPRRRCLAASTLPPASVSKSFPCPFHPTGPASPVRARRMTLRSEFPLRQNQAARLQT
jgi:hypothetical protein